MICQRCKRELAIGEWPFCNGEDGHGFPAANSRAQVDEWPSGKTFEMGFPEPRTFYSRSEYRKALAERGLMVRGDGEEHGSWLSAEALRKAEELVRR